MPTPTKTPQSQQPCSEAESAQLLEAAATLMKGGEDQASLSLVALWMAALLQEAVVVRRARATEPAHSRVC